MKIAFKRDPKPLAMAARGIRLWTFGKYYHVELLFQDGMMFSAIGKSGTRWMPLVDKKEWDFLTVPVTPGDEERIRAFCHSQEDKGYDFIGLFLSFLPIPIGWQSCRKWFCSELCTAGLQLAGYLSGYTPSRISPNKLYRILRKELRERRD